jgi:hypothetical protein
MGKDGRNDECGMMNDEYAKAASPVPYSAFIIHPSAFPSLPPDLGRDYNQSVNGDGVRGRRAA